MSGGPGTPGPEERQGGPAGPGRIVPAADGPARVAVLVSGSGTNLQALLDRFRDDGDDAARVRLVLGSDGDVGALERARAAGVETGVVPREDDEGRRLLDALESRETELVVLAGYLRLVPARVVRAFRGRMVNIHPALLPSFGGEGMYGRRIHEAVLASGARVTGPTVHFVDEEYDRGSIIAQWPVPVKEDDEPDTLAARVLEREHELLPRVVSELARGRVWLDSGGRTRWDRPWFPGDRFVLE